MTDVYTSAFRMILRSSSVPCTSSSEKGAAACGGHGISLQAPPASMNFHTHFQIYPQLSPPNMVFEVCKVDEYNWL